MSHNQALIVKMQSRQGYRNVWHTDLLHSVQADCPYFCFALWCGPCASYLLRKRALYGDMSRYLCCAGFMPCSGSCGERECPELCLCTEVWCCFANSVQSTRFLLQDEFNIQTTKCDNCIIGFMICLQQLACIFSIIACLVGSDELSAAANILNCASDAVYCTVCGCMQTQHKVEMDKRDGKFGDPPMRAPQPAVMSRFDQSVPPAVGYPPQAPGYAPAYPPPGGAPPAYGGQPYPPQGAAPPYGQQYPYGAPPAGASPYGAPPAQPYGTPQGYGQQYPPPATYPPQGY